MTAEARVTLEIDSALATVSLVNPARHNAMTIPMWHALARMLDELNANEAVRVVTLQGGGESAFCSGADLSQSAQDANGSPMPSEMNEASADAIATLLQCQKPVVAKIRGVCMGGGMELASACDLRIAAEDARFRMPAARLGIGYPFKGIQRYVAQMGPLHTFDIFATARTFNGEEALRLGFVNRVCSASELDGQAKALASSIGDLAPMTLRAMKLSVQGCMAEPSADQLAGIQEAIDACSESADFAEGVAAFKEKRAARFLGR